MHFLDRTKLPAPACLELFDPQQDSWDCKNFVQCKAEIRCALSRLQADRCAYCESPLYGHDGHIEHFRRKHPDHAPELTFDWSNLFLSCDSWRNCGHYKDRPKAPSYRSKDLVKPDVDDPEAFFFFHSSGEVRVRGGIAPSAQARAEETIRVFGLNDPALKDLRRKAVARYRHGQSIIDDPGSLTPAEVDHFIDDELRATETIPFRTAVHHFLMTRPFAKASSAP
jgi:uncharacterized protein (TIGR02646 family)